MKKFTILLLSTFLTVSLADCAFADNTYSQTSTTEYLGDGLYLTITIDIEETSSAARQASSKTVSKVYTITNSKAKKLAEYKLTGRFIYTGSSSSCMTSSHDTTIYNSDYKFTSATSSHSGNTCTGEFTCKRYFFGISIETITKKLTISCDKNGNIV